MTNAQLDGNGRPSMTALLNTNGSTITRIKASSSTHSVKVNNNTTGSDNGGNHGVPDENTKNVLFAESSAGDGTLVSLYVNSDGELLIDSN